MPVIVLARRRVSKTAAFSEHGVALKYSSASWSGVRSDDGMVVFAVRVEDVIADREGSRCLLWAPDAGAADSLARQERLKHCVLACSHGQAEGLLAFADGAQVDPAFVLSMRVERHRQEYWAKWGSAGRVVPAGRYAVRECALVAQAG